MRLSGQELTTSIEMIQISKFIVRNRFNREMGFGIESLPKTPQSLTNLQLQFENLKKLLKPLKIGKSYTGPEPM